MKRSKPFTGDDLKNYRLLKGMTQQGIASSFSVSRNNLGAWERRGPLPLSLRGQRILNDLIGADEFCTEDAPILQKQPLPPIKKELPIVAQTVQHRASTAAEMVKDIFKGLENEDDAERYATARSVLSRTDLDPVQREAWGIIETMYGSEIK